MNHILLTILVTGMVIAMFRDLRTSKIPNAVTFPLIIAGIVGNAWLNGLNGLGFSIGGLFLGMGIFIVPYAAGGMGAGDVKLMGAVGAILGSTGAIIVAVFSILLGGIYALFLLIVHRDYTHSLLSRFWHTLKYFSLTRQFILFQPNSYEKRVYLKFGLPIALGTMSYVFLQYNGIESEAILKYMKLSVEI